MNPKIIEVTKEMLAQRGCKDIIDVEPENSNWPLMLEATKPGGKKLCVIFAHGIKFNSDRFKEYSTFVDSAGIDHCIIVYNEDITTNAKKATKESAMKFEVFTELQLSFNITKHHLVPPHVKLPKQMADRLRGEKLPVLKVEDPVVRFYGYDRGDVIKIARRNGTIVYRIVK